MTQTQVKYQVNVSLNNSKIVNELPSKGLKFSYTNADQFVNKREGLLILIGEDKPDVILTTEIIPKSQVNPISWTLLEIDGYKPLLNFDPDDLNLGAR